MKKYLFLILLCFTVPLYSAVIDKILATVNGEPVTLSELEHLLVPVYKQYEKAYTGQDLENIKKMARHELLEQLIENKLILQKAKKEGLAITEAGVEEEMAETRYKFGTTDDFKKALESEGMTIEQYKKDLTDQLTVKAMIERELVPKAKVSPEEISDHYKNNKDEFISPKMVRFGHILIKTDEKKIQDIYTQLNEGKDFDKLAEEFSDAGDPGFIPIKQLKPELRNIIENLKENEYSKIIKTDIGWHIIQLKGWKEESVIPLAEAWTGIEDKLFRNKLSYEHKKWIVELKEKAHIVTEE